jgi:hypothetical protein
MLLGTKQLKTVNAISEVYDDSATYDESIRKETLDKCAEIALPYKIRSIVKDTA